MAEHVRKRFTRKVRLPKATEPTDVTVEVSVDLEGLALQLTRRAVVSKRGLATAAAGLVRVRWIS